MTDNRVPGWVYRPELRAPGTDDEPWATATADRDRRSMSRIATVLIAVLLVAVAFAAGYGSNR